jgi:hypothetical protein
MYGSSPEVYKRRAKLLAPFCIGNFSDTRMRHIVRPSGGTSYKLATFQTADVKREEQNVATRLYVIIMVFWDVTSYILVYMHQLF